MSIAQPYGQQSPIDHSSTLVKPHTERKLKRFAGIVAAALIIGFLAIHHVKSVDQATLANAALREASSPPPVDVITVQNSPVIFSFDVTG